MCISDCAFDPHRRNYVLDLVNRSSLGICAHRDSNDVCEYTHSYTHSLSHTYTLIHTRTHTHTHTHIRLEQLNLDWFMNIREKAEILVEQGFVSNLKKVVAVSLLCPFGRCFTQKELQIPFTQTLQSC